MKKLLKYLLITCLISFVIGFVILVNIDFKKFLSSSGIKITHYISNGFEGHIVIKKEISEKDSYSFNKEKKIVSDNIQFINLKTKVSDIKLHISNENEIKLVFHGKINKEKKEFLPEFIVEEKTDNVNVELKWKDEKDMKGKEVVNIDSLLDVYVPVAILSALSINTESGNIDVGDIIAKNVYCVSVSGNTVANILKVDRLSIKTTSGNINVKKVESKDIFIDNVSGNIEIEELISEENKINSVSGDVLIRSKNQNYSKFNLSTVSGDVKLESLGENGKIIIKSVSGEIDVELLEKPYVELLFKTISGGLNTGIDFDYVVKSKRKIIGRYHSEKTSRSYVIEAETVSGDLEIQ